MTKYYASLAEAHPNIEASTIAKGSPHFNLTRNDSVAVALQYLHSERASLSPLLRTRSGSPLYATLEHEFASLWEANAPA